MLALPFGAVEPGSGAAVGGNASAPVVEVLGAVVGLVVRSVVVVEVLEAVVGAVFGSVVVVEVLGAVLV